jgi:hypothetical protein
MEPQRETIQIDALTAAKLRARAEAQGITVDELIRTLAEETNGTDQANVTLPPEERLKLWEEWITHHSVSIQGLVDDSRESIYREREDKQI